MSFQAEPFDPLHCPLEGSHLIEASAGTGKTWNICAIYLRLLLERDLAVQQILVVTFTKAATAELRTRIRAQITAALACLSARNRAVQSEDPDTAVAAASEPFLAALIESLCSTSPDRAPQMTKALQLALESFDEAAIFTMHGFCQRVLADAPMRSGAPLVTSQIEDDSAVIEEVVHDFWRTEVAGNATPQWLVDHLRRHADTPENYVALLRRHLAQPTARNLWPGITSIDHEILATVNAPYRELQRIWRDGRNDIHALLQAHRDALNKRTYSDAALQTAMEQWDEWIAADDPLHALVGGGERLALLGTTALVQKTNKGKATPRHVFFDQAQLLIDGRILARRWLDVQRLTLLRRLIDEGSSRVRQRKRELHLLAFDDMLFNLHRALLGPTGPELVRTIRQEVPAALIDEFQDTDPLQYEIFWTIYRAEKSILFLVGDPKQAIYSFRNADLYIYLRARQHIDHLHTLTVNRRSNAGLIQGLNQLFHTNPDAFVLPDLKYQNVAPALVQRPPFRDGGGDCGDLQIWLLPYEQEQLLILSEARNTVITATAREIARLIGSQGAQAVRRGDLPLQPSDIAVLVRSHAQGLRVKEALAALNIGSVELSQDSVFQSADAKELQYVLMAILDPVRTPRLRAALASQIMGYQAMELAALTDDSPQMVSLVERFAQYRETWHRLGVGFMFRQLLRQERVSEKLLARSDGERRLTNILHLADCLHQAQSQHPVPDALMRWYQVELERKNNDEALQLRLESDQNLVQIVTIHKSKGLEYPVVFCPFLWEGPPRLAGARIPGRAYHDEESLVIDFREPFLSESEQLAINHQIEVESAAEFVRLAYVALTRAIDRCYLVAGCHAGSSKDLTPAQNSTQSLLNWLLANQAMPFATWRELKLDPQESARRWTDVFTPLAPAVRVVPIPTASIVPVSSSQVIVKQYSASPPPAHIPDMWRIGSYTGLLAGAIESRSVRDHDAGTVGEARQITPTGIEQSDDDVLKFPRGARAGDCLHAVLQRVEFTQDQLWPALISSCLDDFPDLVGSIAPTVSRLQIERMILQMLRDVMTSELPDRIRLDSIAKNARLTELEFHFPVTTASSSTLNDCLQKLGYTVPTLHFGRWHGYLRGFIDLVIAHEGRYYIIDWKSNYLGDSEREYGPLQIDRAMEREGYHLQYLLYSVALHRYLGVRIPDYRYEQHFGGVLYLFLRAVRPAWRDEQGSPRGVYFHRPTTNTILTLADLLTQAGAIRP